MILTIRRDLLTRRRTDAGALAWLMCPYPHLNPQPKPGTFELEVKLV
jgi:hypothetical protein